MIGQISRLSGLACRQFALMSVLLGLGIPVVCLISFVALALAMSPLIGSAAWGPADSFISSLALSVTVSPGLIGAVGLIMLALMLPIGDGFAYWCLAQTNIPSLTPLLVWVARSILSKLAINPPLNSLRQILPLTSLDRLLIRTRNQIASSTPSDLAGAAPLLI